MADISKIKLPNNNTYNIKDASAVKGPSSSTADHIATFSDTTGKLIKDSGKSLSDYLPLSGGTMAGTISSQIVQPKTTNAYTLGGSSNRWSTVYGVDGNYSGTVTSNKLTVSNTDGQAHLEFSRGAYNYIHAKTSGGKLCFVVNGQTLATANCEAIIEDGAIYPGTTNVTDLGKSDYKWKNLYVTNINGVAVGSSPKFTDSYVYLSTSSTPDYRPIMLGKSSTTSITDAFSDTTNQIYQSTALRMLPSSGNILTLGSIRVGATSATSGCTMQYDSTEQCIKFVF